MDHPAPDTRTALLQAALGCFADHGFEGASMRMIADKAGRPLSLLSHYFGNKEGLYLEVFKHLLETSVRRPSHPVPVAGLDPQDRAGAIRLLREEIHLMHEQAAPNHAFERPMEDARARLWTHEFRAPRPSLHPLFRQYLGPAAETIRACLRVLRPDLSEAQVAFVGITIMGQVAGHGMMSGLNKVLWGDHPPFGSPFQEAEFLVDFCLEGLTPGRRAE